ncbi:MAG: hypothetical protein LBQ54_09095 [Planctomycetaceae bacterium]|nr:hypothetical protein [Planctomycetaceae bacterium]
MNTLSIVIAILPLALYFIALSAMNSGRRSRLVTGQRDLTALALGMIGFVMIGPVMLFLPVDALGFWKIRMWPMIAVLYSLLVIILSAMFPPRLVIYNTTPEKIRLVLETAALLLGQEFQWLGNSFALPELKIQLYLESSVLLRNVSLIATGTGQDIQNWGRLEKTLLTVLAGEQTSPTWVWLVMLGIGLGIGLTALTLLCLDSRTVLVAIQDFLS